MANILSKVACSNLTITETSTILVRAKRSNAANTYGLVFKSEPMESGEGYRILVEAESEAQVNIGKGFVLALLERQVNDVAMGRG